MSYLDSAFILLCDHMHISVPVCFDFLVFNVQLINSTYAFHWTIVNCKSKV